VKARTINRLTAGLATGVFLVLSLLLANLSTPQRGDSLLRRPSTFFTDPSGARALLLVLREFMPSAEQWHRPFQFLPPPGDAGTLFIAGPQRPLAEREAEALERWLQAGGQLVLLTANGWPMRPDASAGEIDNHDAEANRKGEDRTKQTFLGRWEPALTWTKAENEMRTGQGSGASIVAPGITLGWRAGFRTTGKARVIATASNTALAIELPVGRGRIVAVADPTMASNGALRRSDNAVWLVGLLTGWSAGRVLFDEYHHGFGQKRGALELAQGFFSTAWGWCVLQLAAAGLIYVFVCRRRFGRVREPLAAERSSPLELIGARAGIFQAAGAQRLAADLIVQHLCHSLAKARGKLIDSVHLQQELDTVLPQTASAGDNGLRRLYGKVQQGERLSDREFMQLGKAAGEIIERSNS
jgi:hypothetical protein